MTLSEALEQVELEPGKTYRCSVRGMMVELQVRADELRPCDLVPSDDWVELPGPKPIARVKATYRADVSPMIPADGLESPVGRCRVSSL